MLLAIVPEPRGAHLPFAMHPCGELRRFGEPLCGDVALLPQFGEAAREARTLLIGVGCRLKGGDSAAQRPPRLPGETACEGSSFRRVDPRDEGLVRPRIVERPKSMTPVERWFGEHVSLRFAGDRASLVTKQDDVLALGRRGAETVCLEESAPIERECCNTGLIRLFGAAPPERDVFVRADRRGARKCSSRTSAA